MNFITHSYTYSSKGKDRRTDPKAIATGWFTCSLTHRTQQQGSESSDRAENVMVLMKLERQEAPDSLETPSSWVTRKIQE